MKWVFRPCLTGIPNDGMPNDRIPNDRIPNDRIPNDRILKNGISPDYIICSGYYVHV